MHNPTRFEEAFGPPVPTDRVISYIGREKGVTDIEAIARLRPEAGIPFRPGYGRNGPIAFLRSFAVLG